MKVSGHGGFWVLYGGAEAESDTVVHNSEYDFVVEIETREVRSAGCEGWTEDLPRIRRFESATLRVAEDDTAFPQALGMTEGAELDIWFKRGALDEYDKVSATIVKRVRVTNPQTAARRVEVVCGGGRFERGAATPVLPTPDPPPE